MQSFRGGSAAPNAESKRSFGIFGTIIRKPKVEPTPPQQQLPPPTPPKIDLPPPSPPTAPAEQAPKQEAAPRQRGVTKKPSTDVDDELRKHLQREGFAFLAFMDPEKAAAVSQTPPTPKPMAVVDPVESSRRDGTLLKDAIERMEKTSTEASHSVPVKKEVDNPKPTHIQRPPLRKDSLLDTSRSLPEQPRQVTPAVLKKEKPSEHTPPVVSKIEENIVPRPTVVAVPAASTGGNSSGMQTTTERTSRGLNSQQPGSAAAATARYSSNGTMDRKVEQRTSDKSLTDSGKEVGVDSQDRSANGKSLTRNDSPRSETHAEVPARIPESPAMARFAQEASMQDVDPRRSARNPANYNQHMQPRRSPPNDVGRHPGQGSENGLGSRTQSYERLQRPSPLPTNPDGNRSLQSLTVDEEEDSLEESPRSFNLPIPVMLPPEEYKVVPNELQRTCPVSHRSTVMSSNIHHRICCMVCQSDSSAERWLCTYCALRFCSRCKAEFATGNTLEQIIEKAVSEDWRSQSSSPSSPVRGAPERNIPWELACVMESGGRLQGPRLRSPPNGRGPPPQRQISPVYPNGGPSPANRSGKSSPHSLSDERIPMVQNQPPSPTWSDQDKVRSRNSSRNSHRYEDAPTGYDREARRRTVERIMKDGRNMSSAARCSPAVLNGSGTAAEQRRALLQGASY
ncbi:hypothetical protein K440DRAFT_630405 [Wilcoxina mikolae CBS 423.85]|nr:hypothetical protein K440DRAFT_630405 [Wilcoxina mikolae CBS 423.85]